MYNVQFYSSVNNLSIPTVALGRIQCFLSHRGIGRDGLASFNFYIYFCVLRIRSVYTPLFGVLYTERFAQR